MRTLKSLALITALLIPVSVYAVGPYNHLAPGPAGATVPDTFDVVVGPAGTPGADVTDTTITGFNEAIALAGATGITLAGGPTKTILYMPGFYRMVGAVVPAGITIYALPGSSTVWMNGTATIVTIYGTVDGITFDGGQAPAGTSHTHRYIEMKTGGTLRNYKIRGMTGAMPNGAGSAAISIQQSSNIVVQNGEYLDTPRGYSQSNDPNNAAPWFIKGSSNVLIDGLYVQSFLGAGGGGGITFLNAQASRDIIVQNLRFRSSGQGMIRFNSNASRCIARNNYFVVDAALTGGIIHMSESSNTITNNIIISNDATAANNFLNSNVASSAGNAFNQVISYNTIINAAGTSSQLWQPTLGGTLFNTHFIGNTVIDLAGGMRMSGDNFTIRTLYKNNIYNGVSTMSALSENFDLVSITSGAIYLSTGQFQPSKAPQNVNYTTIYSSFDQTTSTAEVFVADGGGNRTKISPHNRAGNWVFDSSNDDSGKHVYIDMEHFIGAMEEHMGRRFIFGSEAEEQKYLNQYKPRKRRRPK